MVRIVTQPVAMRESVSRTTVHEGNNRSRPTKDEAWLNARAFASAAAPAEGLTQLQAFALRGLERSASSSVGKGTGTAQK